MSCHLVASLLESFKEIFNTVLGYSVY